MPLPIITNVVRASIRGTCPSGQRWVNVLHFKDTAGVPSPSDISALEPKILKLYAGPVYTGGDFFLHRAVAACTLDDITITPLDGTSASTVYSTPTAGTGVATATLPSEVSFVLTLRTTVRGRSHRGRVYLPPMNQGSLAVGGIIDPTVITNLVAQGNGFLADLASVNWQWVVASYKLSTATAVSVCTMDNRCDVQRGRK